MINRIICRLALLTSLLSSVHAFDVDGFKAGISLSETQDILAKRSALIVTKIDSGLFVQTGDREALYALSFYDERLVSLQKFLPPSFEQFVQVIAHYRERLGRPLDSFGVNTDPLNPYSKPEVRFIWLTKTENIEVSYQSNQLSVIYNYVPQSDK